MASFEELSKKSLKELNAIIEEYVEEITADYGDSNAETEWQHNHFCLSHYNWDGGMEFPKAVIAHPDCDKGTALLTFWFMMPSFYLKYSEEEFDKYELEDFIFLKKIAEKFVNGEFKTEKIKFDPQNDNGINWIKNLEGIKKKNEWEIPEILFKATEGRIISDEEY